MTEQNLIEQGNAITRMERIDLLKTKYPVVKIGEKAAVVRDNHYQWGVVTLGDQVIVPFGKYEWIDGFDSGLARVRSHGSITYSKNTIGVFKFDDNNPVMVTREENVKQYKIKDRKEHPEKYAKWGIINEKGEEVLPLEYDDIWGFLGKGRSSTTVEKDGLKSEVYFCNLNPSLPVPKWLQKKEHRNDYRDYFTMDDCYDYEGNLDYDRLEDAIMDGEYVPEDW